MNQPSYSRRDAIKTMGLGAAALSLGATHRGWGSEKPNVLMIAVDDLRPQLNCYGHRQMHSPNIDRLAEQGCLFTHAYCQIAVCGASRASLLTGLRPTPTRFTSYRTWAEEDAPESLSLPKHFRNHGYHTVSNGKIYHHANDQRAGWSEDPWTPPSNPGVSWRDYVKPENIELDKSPDHRGPAYESAEVEDDAYRDGKLLKKSVDDLSRLKEQDAPFFLAVGFYKPHLPFNAPKKYWDLYEWEKIDLADNPFRPYGAPDQALHNWGELRNYYGIPSSGPLDDDLARTLVHGYYACVSYTDALIGRLLDELDRLGLRDNTIVVLWGDHGWNLREHGLWCKHCNFETSVHSPVIVNAPGMQAGTQTDGLIEYVDIYPSLCELAGLPVPDGLQGTSFVPLMNEPERPWKKAAFSRWGNGETARTERYRYMEWTNNNGEVTARALFDHQKDPHENINVADQLENQKVVAAMHEMIEKGWKHARPAG